MPSPDVPTTAIIGYGTIVSVMDLASPSAYFELVEVKEVTPPNEQVDDVEVTHYQSPGRTREYIAGLIEGGEASCLMNRYPGSATEVLITALKIGGDKKMIKIEWPNSSGSTGVTWEFLGHIKGYETTAPVDGPMEATVTFKVDGSQTITIPSPLP